MTQPEQSLAVLRAVDDLLTRGGAVADLGPRLVALIGQGLAWDVAALWLIDAQSQELRCQARWSDDTQAPIEQAIGQAEQPIPLAQIDPATIQQALTEPALRWFDSLPRSRLAPSVERTPVADIQSAVLLPLTTPQAAFGLLELGSLTSRPATPMAQTTLTLLGHTIGAYLSQLHADVLYAQLTERAERAQVAHSTARHRLAFLAAASGVLTASFDTDTILTNLAQFVVPQLADWCVIDTVDERQVIRRALVYHDDPAKAALTRALQDQDQPTVGAPGAVAQAIETGQEQLYAEVSAPLLHTLAQDVQQMQLLQALGVVSALIMPILAQEQTLGALTLFSGDPQRRFGPADLALVKDLARRAGLALINARLYTTLQEALRRNDEALTLLNTFLATAPLGIGFWDTALRCVRINPTFARLCGVAPESCVGRPLHELLPDAAAQVVAAAIQVLQSGRPVTDQEVMESVTGQPNQARYWLISIYPVGTPQAPLGIGVVVMDITERKRLEAQLLHIQKLENIGQLAGGIAHDFNNVLTAIMGYASFALEELDPDSSAYADTQEVLQVAQRATALTRQLLAFARKQVIAPQVLNLNELVRELSGMLRRVIGDSIDLVTELAQDLHLVKVDPGQMEQVLVNLAVNARDAMPDGGTLTLATANVLRQPAEAPLGSSADPQPSIMITVTDTGVGMAEEVRQHLFEPFFTTKETGRGTGLGLATCYGIIQQHGGWIDVASEPQHGSTFTVILPRAADTLASELPLDADMDVRQGSETVLLVEDDRDVRALAARTLRSQGYTVLEAAAGDEALRVAELYGQRIHLLCTDSGLPHGSGEQLAITMQQRDPSIRVLRISGYTDTTLSQLRLLPDSLIQIQKPFTPALLMQKVREALDQPG